ncbi:macro domain-containing protein [Leifsonia sp. Leaf264]|uniref:macro domain-containing protein n=1 Tax=Leifsonia sp. Leaf264 TaxID=1736314 RepID=UPI000AD7D72B|nr:macro domain-containing protein [Leifsonia sp. Leaf264]
MGALILKTGDLFTSTAPALMQGVNVDGQMWSGIAPTFRDRFPMMHDMYLRICANQTFKPGQFFYWPPIENRTAVFNLASQDRRGANARLEWLEESLRKALDHADEIHFKTVAMPRIGCGVGGLDWADVEPVVAALAQSHQCDVEVWTQRRFGIGPRK